MSYNTPNYLSLISSGELHNRVASLDNLLEDCTLCPHSCHINRKAGEIGFCRSGYLPIVSSYCVHHGEEPVISGNKGSGTIFFGNCNLHCIFCQNHQISQPEKSQRNQEMSFERLADIMIELQTKGCHNINLVSPSHFAAQIVKALEIAVKKGLKIPLVYNTNSYESLYTLKLLDGIIDIYLPDIKYSDNNNSFDYSRAEDYVRQSKAAILEMKRQVGNLIVDDNDIAIRGLIIRHLVLPNGIAGSEESLRFISNEVGRETFLSVMSQYFPTHKAKENILLSNSLTEAEYERVIDYFKMFGLENGWIQEYSSRDYYCPDFEKDEPFEKVSPESY
ncbi:MAG TPA: radical SAM protein [Nitrospinae bacterium]|nr:radical SAM protein [Nitrospinota bacterium]HBA25848.1 radical SAM protein [Nitrospinota bacterium]